MPKKKIPVLKSNIFKNPDKVNNYFQLVKFMVSPVCIMCKYQWYDNIFEKNRVGVWKGEI